MPELIGPLEIVAHSNVILKVDQEYNAKRLKVITSRGETGDLQILIGPNDDGNMPIEITNPDRHIIRTRWNNSYDIYFKKINVPIVEVRRFRKPLMIGYFLFAANKEILNESNSYRLLCEDVVSSEEYLERVRELRGKR